MKINVPYASQWDISANLSKDDCGPACISMILNYYGENTNINDVFTKTGAKKDSLISIAQMQTAIKSWGYESTYEIGKTWDDCRKLLNENTPVILLIHYGPLSSRQDKNYSGGHFIVLTGEDNDCWLVNDPDFWNGYRVDGEQHRYLKNEMEMAWGQCAKDGNPPYSYLAIKRKGVSNIYKGIDLTNIESIKVCVDTWKDVVDGKYVKKTDYDEIKIEIDGVKTQNKSYADTFNKLAEKLKCKPQEAEILGEVEKLITTEDQHAQTTTAVSEKQEEKIDEAKKVEIISHTHPGWLYSLGWAKKVP